MKTMFQLCDITEIHMFAIGQPYTSTAIMLDKDGLLIG